VRQNNAMPGGGVPLLGQRKSQAEAAVMQAMGNLSVSIYQRVVAGMLVEFPTDEPDPERFRQLAKHSQVAAQAYFEGIGVISREDGA